MTAAHLGPLAPEPLRGPLTTQAARLGLDRLRNTDQGWETQMSIILGTMFLLASGLVIRAMLKAPA